MPDSSEIVVHEFVAQSSKSVDVYSKNGVMSMGLI